MHVIYRNTRVFLSTMVMVSPSGHSSRTHQPGQSAVRGGSLRTENRGGGGGVTFHLSDGQEGEEEFSRQLYFDFQGSTSRLSTNH